VNQEKSFACAEIESARAVVQRIGEALDEEERDAQNSKNQAAVSSFIIKCFLLNYLLHPNTLNCTALL